MSSIIGRAAFRATHVLRESGVNAGKKEPSIWKQVLHLDDRPESKAIKRGAKRDPELYPLYFITAAVFVWAGWRFAQSPTGADETEVARVPHSEPWKDANTTGKYQFYTNGGEKKNAPSALNTVIIPNVNLPKSLHDQFNKWGKPGF